MSDSKKLWVSRILIGMVTVALAVTAAMKIGGAPKMVDGLTRAGIPKGAVLPIAFLELACLAVYLVPRTAILGAVLLTGYFGGAMVVHIITKDSVIPLIMIGIWVWGGVYFRFPAVQGLLPIQRELQPARSWERAEMPGAMDRHRAGASRT
jgi:DoxX-like protein